MNVEHIIIGGPTTGRYVADVLVLSADERPVAIMEVKNRSGFDQEDAVGYLRNLGVHGLLPQVPYYVLVSQERGYLWTAERIAKPNFEPVESFPMSSILERYVPGYEHRERLMEFELEYVLFQWLFDLMHAEAESIAQPLRSPEGRMFVQAIQGGHVQMEQPV